MLYAPEPIISNMFYYAPARGSFVPKSFFLKSKISVVYHRIRGAPLPLFVSEISPFEVYPDFQHIFVTILELVIMVILGKGLELASIKDCGLCLVVWICLLSRY